MYKIEHAGVESLELKLCLESTPREKTSGLQVLLHLRQSVVTNEALRRLLLSCLDEEERRVSLRVESLNWQIIRLTVHLGNRKVLPVCHSRCKGIQQGHHILAVWTSFSIQHQYAMTDVTENRLNESLQHDSHHRTGLLHWDVLRPKVFKHLVHANLRLDLLVFGFGLGRHPVLANKVVQVFGRSLRKLDNIRGTRRQIKNCRIAGVLKATIRNPVCVSVQLCNHDSPSLICHFSCKPLILGRKLLAVTTPWSVNFQHDMLALIQRTEHHISESHANYGLYKLWLCGWRRLRFHELLREPDP
mmetsp:Transcript_37603/g.88431  ORF Transcript_37603/g.88431 Transcript_37603/m.88431 type:complete len:302 (-) Transcript_37603:2393-3298(-)